MSTTVIAPVPAFLPSIGKNGKVSASAEKVAQTLNSMTTGAVLGAALTGKGAIAKQAQQALKAHAVTLGSLLNSETLDGSQWGDLFALLRAEYGVACFNRATMKGKHGAVAYLAAVRTDLDSAFNKAETSKAQARVIAKLDELTTIQNRVEYLYEVAAQAAQAARIEQAEQA